jgi:dephospho-CoA kinase
MEVFGITGQMGSGKSFLCNVLGKHGIPVYDCDSRLKDVLLQKRVFLDLSAKDPQLYSVYTTIPEPEFSWNKRYVIEKAKSDPEFLPMLDAWFMPYLIEDIQLFIDEADVTGHKCVAIESATFSASYELLKMLDAIFVVVVPKDVQMKRIKQRDPKRTDAEIEALLKRQRRPINHPAVFTVPNGEDTTEDQIWASFSQPAL